MKNAIEINVEGIQCDTCPYEEPEVKMEDYPDWLNKPCPQCGENLLTEEDYEVAKQLVALVDTVNELYYSEEENETNEGKGDD